MYAAIWESLKKKKKKKPGPALCTDVLADISHGLEKIK